MCENKVEICGNQKTTIVSVTAREILDSRGNPTVEAEVTLLCGAAGRGIAPSGASTGAFEALELRDNDKKRYMGSGVEKAVANVKEKIAPKLVGMCACDLAAVEHVMKTIDGTKDRAERTALPGSKLGANAMLAVSMACMRAAAAAHGLPLYRYGGGAYCGTLPVPMMNILNGGAHASNTVDIQEFMIMPVGACCFKEGLRWCAEVYQHLKILLREKGLSTAVGDEGGFAPDLPSDEQAFDLILEAVGRAGYTAGTDFVLAIDAAASEWVAGEKGEKSGGYLLPKAKKAFTTDQLIAYWAELTAKYPIRSIEDGLAEEDWEGWQKLTKELGNKVQLVGDDLFVTNPQRLLKGIEMGCGNSILIKPNQIGSLSETMETIRMAKNAGCTTIMSHRSGETEDAVIADLAVAFETGQIKTGAPCRSERTAKYNRLLRIEEELGEGARYAGNVFTRYRLP